jgi:hypothetical protein
LADNQTVSPRILLWATTIQPGMDSVTAPGSPRKLNDLY